MQNHNFSCGLVRCHAHSCEVLVIPSATARRSNMFVTDYVGNACFTYFFRLKKPPCFMRKTMGYMTIRSVSVIAHAPVKRIKKYLALQGHCYITKSLICMLKYFCKSVFCVMLFFVSRNFASLIALCTAYWKERSPCHHHEWAWCAQSIKFLIQIVDIMCANLPVTLGMSISSQVWEWQRPSHHEEEWF